MVQIYMHTAPNGKKYIGITQQKLERRWRNGLGYVRNTYFYRAIQKYGWENIDHTVICVCETLEEANKLEAKLIAEYKSNDPHYGYNISGGGDGKDRVAESTRQLRSEQMKGRFAGEKNPNYGRKHTEAERRVMSEKTKGKFIGEKSPKYGKHPSEETRRKMSEARKASPLVQEHMKKMNMAKAKRVLCVETGAVYESARDVARKEGYSCGNISAACRGVYAKAYGYHWEYV